MKFEKITISQFIKCKTIAELETDPLNRNIKLLAELTNKTFDEIESMPIEDLTKSLKAFSEIVNAEELIRRNWKLMYFNTSNLAAFQIEKIHGTLEQHKPSLDKYGFMKETAKNGLNFPFDFNNFCNLLKQNLLFE